MQSTWQLSGAHIAITGNHRLVVLETDSEASLPIHEDDANDAVIKELLIDEDELTAVTPDATVPVYRQQVCRMWCHHPFVTLHAHASGTGRVSVN
jgi:hypothetical protein